MSAPIPKIVASHTITYTDRDGNPQERIFRSSINGNMKIHSGGSVYLGTCTLMLLVPTTLGDILVSMSKLVARIRVDGECVLEPDQKKLRDVSWFDDDGNEQPGGMFYDLIGDESRIALAKVAEKTLPAFAKRVKSARAALAKRAA